ncbi:MAG: hypothetical protein ABI479_08750 [Gallionella sp.]
MTQRRASSGAGMAASHPLMKLAALRFGRHKLTTKSKLILGWNDGGEAVVYTLAASTLYQTCSISNYSALSHLSLTLGIHA